MRATVLLKDAIRRLRLFAVWFDRSEQISANRDFGTIVAVCSQLARSEPNVISKEERDLQRNKESPTVCNVISQRALSSHRLSPPLSRSFTLSVAFVFLLTYDPYYIHIE